MPPRSIKQKHQLTIKDVCMKCLDQNATSRIRRRGCKSLKTNNSENMLVSVDNNGTMQKGALENVAKASTVSIAYRNNTVAQQNCSQASNAEGVLINVTSNGTLQIGTLRNAANISTVNIAYFNNAAAQQNRSQASNAEGVLINVTSNGTLQIGTSRNAANTSAVNTAYCDDTVTQQNSSLPISKGIDNCPDSVRAPCAVLPQQSYHECDYGANNYIMELENDNKKLKHENQYFKNLFYSYLISNDSAENQPCTPKATETFSEETYTYTTL